MEGHGGVYEERGRALSRAYSCTATLTNTSGLAGCLATCCVGDSSMAPMPIALGAGWARSHPI
eukprot:3188671-Prymnesium_polylepis.1